MHKLPRMNKVESSVVKEIGYKKKEECLYVKFMHNGEKVTYVYRDVYHEQYKLFLNSESKGQFFNSFVKNGYYSTKIEKLDKKGAAETSKSVEKAWRTSLNDVQHKQLENAEKMISDEKSAIIDLEDDMKYISEDIAQRTENSNNLKKYLQFVRDSLGAPKASK